MPTTDSRGQSDRPTVEQLNQRLGELAEAMGIRFTSADPERLVATMPVAGNRQPYGLLHGGANAVLAETLGSLAAALHSLPAKYPVGIDLNCTHLRSAREGQVTGVCTPLSLGRTVAALSIAITDDSGRLVSTARLTCLLRDTAPGAGLGS